MEIKIKKLRPDARLPKRGTDAAAGADLYACFDGESVIIEPGKTVLVGTGIASEIPDGYCGLIMARSGLASKRGLAPANKVGLVDSDYRGEIMVALHNHGTEAQAVDYHERIAQYVIVPYVKADYVEYDDLSDTERGEGGFGSTGRR